MLHRLFAFVNAEQCRGARLISGQTLTLSTKMDIGTGNQTMEVCVCGCVCFSHGKNTHTQTPGAKKTPWAKLAKNDPQTTQIITKFNPFLAPPQNQIFCTCLSQTRGKSGLSLFTRVLDLITVCAPRVVDGSVCLYLSFSRQFTIDCACQHIKIVFWLVIKVLLADNLR